MANLYVCWWVLEKYEGVEQGSISVWLLLQHVRRSGWVLTPWISLEDSPRFKKWHFTFELWSFPVGPRLLSKFFTSSPSLISTYRQPIFESQASTLLFLHSIDLSICLFHWISKLTFEEPVYVSSRVLSFCFDLPWHQRPIRLSVLYNSQINILCLCKYFCWWCHGFLHRRFFLFRPKYSHSLCLPS